MLCRDMRGHGRSSYPPSQDAYSEAHTVADMLALLDHVCGKNSTGVIGGLSLGGYMSLAFHRRHPNRVSALLLIATGPGFKKDSSRDEWNKTAYQTADNFDLNGLSVLESRSSEQSQAMHRNAKGLALAARGMLAQQDSNVFYSLPSIKVPALVVVGADDQPFLAASAYMAKSIRGAQKVVVSGAGHATNIDQPEGFMRALRPWLGNVGGQARSSL